MDFPDHWIHVRPSNTEPIIRVLAEARTRAKAESALAAAEGRDRDRPRKSLKLRRSRGAGPERSLCHAQTESRKKTSASRHPVGRPPAAFVLIRAGAVMTPGATIPDGAVLARGRRIIAVGTYKKVEAAARRLHNRSKRFHLEIYDRRGLIAVPGLIDIHQHGGGGADYMDAEPEAVRTVLMTHAREGTTAVIPTLMTASRRADRKGGPGRRRGPPPGAARLGKPEAEGGPAVLPDILGLHLEGPHIAAEKKGAQPEAYIRRFDAAAVKALAKAVPTPIRIVTLAPEKPGAAAFIRSQGPGHHRRRGALGRDLRTGAGRLRGGDQPRHPSL